METPPIGEYDASTDIAEGAGSEPVYAEMTLNFPEDSMTAELSVWGEVGGFGDNFRFHESEERHPTLTKAQLFYESNDGPLGIEEYEYRMMLDVESYSVSGRIAVPLRDEAAERIVDEYSDGVWYYAE